MFKLEIYIIMKRKITFSAICMAAALLAQSSPAQQSDPTQTQSSSSSQDTSSKTTSASKGGVHLSKLLGSQVKSKDGDNLGKLEDVILDPQTARPKFAIIEKSS